MNDIVERLRAAARHPYMDNTCKVRTYDALEAADEIDKLREALRESDQNFMRVDKERMKLRAKLMAATGELCDAAAAALKETGE